MIYGYARVSAKGQLKGDSLEGQHTDACNSLFIQIPPLFCFHSHGFLPILICHYVHHSLMSEGI